jgi:5-methyltetrahydrofolate--homocysteine methyltransferase
MDKLKILLYEGDTDGLIVRIRHFLHEGIPPGVILNDGLIPGMAVVGEKFKNSEIFIPEVLIAADSMHAATMVLKPYLVQAGIEPIGRVVIGTVKGDLHDIGKNLVMMMLKGAGFEVKDCGIDVQPERFVQALKDTGSPILAMSSLLTTSTAAMRQTIEALKAHNMRDRVKVMVGGAPITKGFAQEIGADGYGRDAAEAVDLAKAFLGIEVA